MIVLSVTTRAQVTALQHVKLLLNKKKALLVDGSVEMAMSTHETSENSKDTMSISPTTRQLLTALPYPFNPGRRCRGGRTQLSTMF